MRQRVVLGILLGMFVTLGFLLVGRVGGFEGDDKPQEDSAEATSSEDAGAADAQGEPDVGVAIDDQEPVEPESLDRPIRVVGTSWELLAPGLVANGGASSKPDSAFSAEGLQVEFDGVDNIEQVRRALARGGEADGGADIAVVALPSFVASYEKLRALQPRVFWVVGWSRGRELLSSSHRDGLRDIADQDTVALRGVAGEPATFFGLYLMELAGIDLGKVELVEELSDGEQRSYGAVSRGRPDLADVPDGHRSLITTADAQGLVSYVAIVSEGFMRRHSDELTLWAKAWQQGREDLKGDVPAAARQIAAIDDEVDVLELVDLLGAIELASTRDNARLAGLSGRTPLPLERQFRLAWDIWRGLGVLSIPRPTAMPIATEVIIALVRGWDDGSEDQRRPANDASGTPPSTRRTLLVHRHKGSHHDAEEILPTIGTIAGVFNRSAIRVSLANHKELSEDVLEQAAERYQIDPDRLLVGEQPHKRRSATIEVYAVD
jgi:hypothetical protein